MSIRHPLLQFFVPENRRIQHPNWPWMFKEGYGPYHIIDPNPSFRKCLQNLDKSDKGYWAANIIIPSFLIACYKGSIFRLAVLGAVIGGTGAGMLAAYVRSFFRLAGIIPNGRPVSLEEYRQLYPHNPLYKYGPYYPE